MLIKEAFALRIENICKDNNITVCKLSHMAGIRRSTIYSLLSPERKDININTVQKICDGLGITFKEFVNSPEFDEIEQQIK